MIQSGTGQYELDATEFQRAIAILQQEQHSLNLSPLQKISFRIYVVFFVLFVFFLICSIISFAIDVEKMRMGQNIAIISVLATGFSFLGAVLCIPFNIFLIRKIVRQKRNLRLLGFSDASDILWKEQSRRRRWARLGAQVALIAGLFFFFLDLVLWFFEGRNFIPTLSIFGLFLVFFSFLKEGKAWLDMVTARLSDITTLEESLKGIKKKKEETHGAQPTNIIVPRATLEKLAEIDTERIVRGRANALAEATRTKSTDFSILSSRQVLEAKTKLDADARIRVEEAIELLMQRPESGKTQEDSADKLLYLPIEGTSLQVAYRVDRSNQQVELMALASAEGKGASHAS